MKHFDVLILGSGISSLATARFLNKFGIKNIGILEQHSVPGGFLHCFKRFGLRFETGAHYIGSINQGEPFHTLLNYLGVYHDDDYIDLEANGPDTHFFESNNFTFPLGYKETIQKLGVMFPNEKKSIKIYFSMIKEAAHSFPTYYYKKDYDQKKMLSFLDQTVQEVLDSLFKNNSLKNILSTTCILYGVSPVDASFGFHSIVQDSYIISAKGFRYGGERLAQRFVKKIENEGGRFFLNHTITDLVARDKEIKEVHCHNGAVFTADKIIAGIHPKLLFSMIKGEGLRKSFQKRLDQIQESNSFLGAFLSLKENPGISPKKNYYFHRGFNYEEPTLDDPKSLFPFFLTSSDRAYKNNGKFPVLLTAKCSYKGFKEFQSNKKSNDYKDLKEKVFQMVLPYIEEQFPGFTKSIDKYCLSSPLTNQKYIPSPNGSAYGIYHDQFSTGARGLGPRTHFHNLILTGQNTLFPGLLGGSISAIKSAGQIIGTKDILKELSH